MALNLNQKDGAATCQGSAYCRGEGTTGSASTSAERAAGVGSTEDTTGNLTNSGATTIAYWMSTLSLDADGMGTNIDAGDWVVRINVTTAEANTDWDDCSICRLNASCTNQETLGNLEDQTIDTGTTGVKSMTISGSATTAGADDVIVAVLAFQNDNAHGNRSLGITPDQVWDTQLNLDTGGAEQPQKMMMGIGL
jgi:hypothetical protein